MTRRRDAQQPTPKEPTPDLLPIQQSLLSAIERSIRVNTDTGHQEITVQDALILQLVQTGVKKGSPHALGQLMRHLQRAQKQKAKLIAEEIALARMRKYRAEEGLRNWTKAGKDPLLYIIHPDDIVITEGVGWKIVGPVDEEELKDVLRRRKERDVCVGQAMLEDRLATKEEWSQAGDDRKKQPGSLAWFLVPMIDSTLPLRFRLTIMDTIKFDRTYNRMTKRELLKHMHKLWRSIGKLVPRGRRLPALHDTMPMINAIAGTTAEMLKRDKTGMPMAE